MAKFYGLIGYAETKETSPGVYTETIVERSYFGDVEKISRDLRTSDKVNDDVTINNRISIVADPYANDHFFDMRYVNWMGQNWKISHVEVQRPRLMLTIGGIYNE